MRRLAAVMLATAFAVLPLPPRPATAQGAPSPPCTFPRASLDRPDLPCATASWPVPGADAATQHAIDRGVAMMYGFNGGEARAYFKEALASHRRLHHGAELAFAWWAIAETYTIDINLPWTAATEKNGALAARNAAQALKPSDDSEMRDLVHAAVARFSGGTCPNELTAYGNRLGPAMARHHDRPNFLVVAGYALYTLDNLTDTDPAQQSACPLPAALAAHAMSEEVRHTTRDQAHHQKQILDGLARAEQLQPWNLGAHHLSIHENEYISNKNSPLAWQRARPDARALEGYGYPDGLSHLPHMAGHIFTRDGEYERTIRTNARALDNDHRYYREGDGEGQHYLDRYHTHDIDFVLYSLTTIGRNDEARAVVQGAFHASGASHGPPIEQYPNGRPLLSLLLRLHDDAQLPSPHPDEAIREPWREQLASLSAARQGAAKLALEIADPLSCAQKDATLALLVRAQIAKHRPGTAFPPYTCAGVPTPPIACARAVDCYAAAYALNRLAYSGDPKDYWMAPVGEGYGAALLAAGQAAGAEPVFRAELARFPNDPHLEWGLAEALKAQGKDDSVPRAAYKTHWKGAHDLTLDDLG
jgi:tetratricopeptide (TPR) repeat protein